MIQINVNAELLEGKIQKIRDLKTTCDGIEVASEPLSGSGESIDLLQLIDEEYALLKAEIGNLLSNSVSFFEGIKNSMIAADQKAAGKIGSQQAMLK